LDFASPSLCDFSKLTSKRSQLNQLKLSPIY